MKIQNAGVTDSDLIVTTNETIPNNAFEQAPIIIQDISKPNTININPELNSNSQNNFVNIQIFKLDTRNEIRKVLKEHGVDTQNLRPELQEYLTNPSNKKYPPYLLIGNHQIIDQTWHFLIFYNNLKKKHMIRYQQPYYYNLFFF